MTAIAAALPVIDLEPARRLRRDIRTAMTTLTPKEARFLVDAYYTLQDYRTQAANQERALTTDGEPAEVIGYLFDNFEVLESQLKRALDAWTDTQELGQSSPLASSRTSTSPRRRPPATSGALPASTRRSSGPRARSAHSTPSSRYCVGRRATRS
jgi:hypothetical protein